MKKNWKRLLLLALFALICGGVVWQFAGCTNDQKIAEAQTEARGLRADLVKHREEAIAAGDFAEADKTSALIESIDAGLAEGENPLAGLANFTEVLPPPWNALAGLGLGAAGGAIARYRKHLQLTGVVGAIQKLREKEPQVAAAMTQHKAELHAVMGKSTAKAVDKIRKAKA